MKRFSLHYNRGLNIHAAYDDDGALTELRLTAPSSDLFGEPLDVDLMPLVGKTIESAVAGERCRIAGLLITAGHPELRDLVHGQAGVKA